MTRIPGGKDIRRSLFNESTDKRCPECQRRMVLNMSGGKPPSTHATLDHVITRADGGSDDRENLRLICRGCNATKASLSSRPNAMPQERVAIALETAGQDPLGFQVDPEHVKLACAMCEIVGLDPNVAVVEGDPTLNWQFYMAPASLAFGLLRPVAPAGDLFAVPHPDGQGWLMRIDKDGQLLIREGCAPMTPIFTLVNAVGDVTLAVGPPDMRYPPENERTH